MEESNQRNMVSSLLENNYPLLCDDNKTQEVTTYGKHSNA